MYTSLAIFFDLHRRIAMDGWVVYYIFMALSLSLYLEDLYIQQKIPDPWIVMVRPEFGKKKKKNPPQVRKGKTPCLPARRYIQDVSLFPHFPKQKQKEGSRRGGKEGGLFFSPGASAKTS